MIPKRDVLGKYTTRSSASTFPYSKHSEVKVPLIFLKSTTEFTHKKGLLYISLKHNKDHSSVQKRNNTQ